MKLKITSLLFLGFLLCANAQFSPVKRFDFSLLENKVLYIPHLEFDKKSKRMQRLLKREKFEKIKSIEEKISTYNKIWAEAMEQSSYKITPYEIKKFNYRELKKTKGVDALVLRFYIDGYANNWVELVSIGPVKVQAVARALISGLDLSTVEDVRLMMNLLNYSLNEAAEIQKSGEKASYTNMRRRYKENFLNFYDEMREYSFLVTEYTHKNPTKQLKKNQDLKEAITTSWNLSDYEFITKEELEKRRADREENTFYWRSFPIYTQSPFVILQLNMLLSTKDDEILFYKEFGSRKLKGSTIKDIQRNIENRAMRYQKTTLKD